MLGPPSLSRPPAPAPVPPQMPTSDDPVATPLLPRPQAAAAAGATHPPHPHPHPSAATVTATRPLLHPHPPAAGPGPDPATVTARPPVAGGRGCCAGAASASGRRRPPAGRRGDAVAAGCCRPCFAGRGCGRDPGCGCGCGCGAWWVGGWVVLLVGWRAAAAGSGVSVRALRVVSSRRSSATTRRSDEAASSAVCLQRPPFPATCVDVRIARVWWRRRSINSLVRNSINQSRNQSISACCRPRLLAAVAPGERRARPGHEHLHVGMAVFGSISRAPPSPRIHHANTHVHHQGLNQKAGDGAPPLLVRCRSFCSKQPNGRWTRLRYPTYIHHHSVHTTAPAK